MEWCRGVGDEDDILVGNILRIIISDEGEVEWGGVGECDEWIEREKECEGGGCVCGEGEVLVFMYKGVFMVDRVTVDGKVS